MTARCYVPDLMQRRLTYIAGLILAAVLVALAWRFGPALILSLSLAAPGRFSRSSYIACVVDKNL